MDETPIVKLIAIAIVAFFVMVLPRLAAEKKESLLPADTQLLLRNELSVIKGKEATITRMVVPPGWVGERHSHTGDVFVYVQEGAFIIDVDGRPRKTIEAGEAFHETVDAVMIARNGRANEKTTLILMQIGNKGDALLIPK